MYHAGSSAAAALGQNPAGHAPRVPLLPSGEFEHQACLSVSESGVAGGSGEEEGVGEEKKILNVCL